MGRKGKWYDKLCGFSSVYLVISLFMWKVVLMQMLQNTNICIREEISTYYVYNEKINKVNGKGL